MPVMNVNTSIYNYHNNAIFKRYYSMKQKIFIVLFLLCSILTGCLSASAYYYPDTYYNSQGENYLQITKIEHALFNRSFENESIYARLNRIEQKLFRATNNYFRKRLINQKLFNCMNNNWSIS